MISNKGECESRVVTTPVDFTIHYIRRKNCYSKTPIGMRYEASKNNFLGMILKKKKYSLRI